MAERRMFAKTIIDSDAFLEMPQSTQNLYFHLAMRADDDGFVNNPKGIIKLVGAAEDDLKILTAKKFIIPFENGVVVIKHWRIHNYIQSDRKHPTKYREQLAALELDENGSYRAKNTECIQIASKMDTEVRLGKDSIGEDNIYTPKNFAPPSFEDVKAYCRERGNAVNPRRFIDFYSSKGWMIGKNKMKDWRAAVRTWEQNSRGDHGPELATEDIIVPTF